MSEMVTDVQYIICEAKEAEPWFRLLSTKNNIWDLEESKNMKKDS